MFPSLSPQKQGMAVNQGQGQLVQLSPRSDMYQQQYAHHRDREEDDSFDLNSLDNSLESQSSHVPGHQSQSTGGLGLGAPQVRA